MSKNIDLVKRMNKASQEKDFDTVKSLLHPQYSLKDPLMQINSPEEFIACMQDCPFTCKLENVRFMEEGNIIVQTLDTVMTAPLSFRFRMCDVLTIEDGKIRSEEVFYDTAQIPEEAKKLGMEMMKKSKPKAA